MRSGACAALTVKEALNCSALLAESSETARIDTEVLLAFSVSRPRTWLFTWPDHQLSPVQQQQFEDCMRRRLAGEPVAYITGRRGFWTFDLQVNPHVLIPRPETEVLVELALTYLRRDAEDIACATEWIADLGTGSGAIALALASERPDARVVAVDLSTSALEVARANAREAGLGNIAFISGNWCDALPAQSFTLIVSNPPYVDRADPHLLRGDLRFEPLGALVADDQGMADIKTICQQARLFLKPGGMLMLEHGYNQAAAVRSVLEHYHYRGIKSCYDLAGHERVTLGSFMPDPGNRENLHA
jgi:release factor glutamine methyltransferase